VLHCSCRGGIQPFYPASGATQLAPTSSSSSSTGSSWYARYVPDEQDMVDAQRLQQEPTGEFLLKNRVPWLVRGALRYTWGGLPWGGGHC
jgi:hypothetical protein